MDTRPLPQVGHAARARRAFATGALHPVGDGAAHVAAVAGARLPDADRYDLDGMEHERQNRLKRWQKPPTPTRRDAA